MRAALILFAKEPRPGFVKTRLSPPMTPARAARVYTALLETLVHRFTIEPLDVDELQLAYHPVDGAPYFEALTRGTAIRAFPQEGDDLLERMDRAFERAFERVEFAVIVGTDVPELHPRHVHAGLELGHDHPVVLGPDTSGGCYLVGRRRGTPSLFASAREGSASFLVAVLEEAGRAGLGTGRLPRLRDLDTHDDLKLFLRTRGMRAERILRRDVRART